MEERTVFATGFTLEDVREAIRDTDEFKVSVYQDEKDGSELLFFNYRFCTHATFPSLDAAKSPRERLLFQLKRECRGLAFRVPKQGEAVVAGRMLHKFFNVEEREETQLDLISLGRPHTLAVKYDGSLVAPIFFNGRVQFGERSSCCVNVALTDSSDQVGLFRGCKTNRGSLWRRRPLCGVVCWMDCVRAYALV